MPVAPSFQSYTPVSEPYEINNKLYIKVQHPTTKNIRQVRYYKTTNRDTEGIGVRSQKVALGFAEGYIYIYPNASEDNDFFLSNPEARYCRLWGWYSLAPIPNQNSVALSWDLVGQSNGSLKPEAAVKAAIDSLIYPPSPSKHLGTIGQKLQLELTVTRNYPLNTQYGTTFVHYFKDSSDNTFIWKTQAKNWPTGTTHRLTARIKDHITEKNEAITVLSYCQEVKQ